MYTLNVTKAIKDMLLNEIRDFIFENYYKRIGSFKENSYYSMKRLKKMLAKKLIEKTPGTRNTKKTINNL